MWCGNYKNYVIYRAVENESDYTKIGVTKDCKFIDKEFSLLNKKRLTYKVVGFNMEEKASFCLGRVAFLHPATDLELERYLMKFKMNNINLM